MARPCLLKWLLRFPFLNGNLYANNNLVGFGERGNGFGIAIGEYDTAGIVLDIFHDLDGHQRFEVYQESVSSIEFYNPANNTSYFLDGYQRNEFDYDAVFFENIDYFLQEYKTWENTLQAHWVKKQNLMMRITCFFIMKTARIYSKVQ